MECAKLLKPIVTLMRTDALLMSRKIHVDDTTFEIQAKGKTHTGRLWVYYGGAGPASECIVYDYTKTRSQKGPQLFLGNYQGYLQADAYSGYDILYLNGNIIEVACMAHARRKFFDITAAVEGDTLAHEALDFIGKLYDVEHRAELLSDAQRKAYRKRYAKPILKRFKRWLRRHEKITLPKSPIGKAIAYSLNHWKALSRYLRDGFLHIDNNAAERAIRPLAIGRKNYLFAGTHEAAENAAIMYSLIETCKLHDINTFDYLKDVITRMPAQLMSKLHELLPYNWKPQ